MVGAVAFGAAVGSSEDDNRLAALKRGVRNGASRGNPDLANCRILKGVCADGGAGVRHIYNGCGDALEGGLIDGGQGSRQREIGGAEYIGEYLPARIGIEHIVPAQVPDFIARTGCDSLAISIGTAHGVYPVKDPKIDFARLKKIRELTDAALVLHGGSGLPEATVHKTIKLDGLGGISKINIATDLELVFQKELGIGRMANAELLKLDSVALEQAGKAVQALVEDRIQNYLFSKDMA